MYKFLKDKINESPIRINVSDDMLQEICTEVTSIEVLQEKLKNALRESKGITEEQLEMVLGTFLRPLNESLNDALDYIKRYPDQISYLLKEWAVENQELIAKFGIEVLEGIDSIKASINEQSDKIDLMMRSLSRFESFLNKAFKNGTRQIFSSDIIMPKDLKLISKAQLSKIIHNIRSKFDIAFDPDLLFLNGFNCLILFV